MSELHDKMLQDMQLRGFSPNTQKTYLKNLQHFEKFFQKPAKQLCQEDLRNPFCSIPEEVLYPGKGIIP